VEGAMTNDSLTFRDERLKKRNEPGLYSLEYTASYANTESHTLSKTILKLRKILDSIIEKGHITPSADLDYFLKRLERIKGGFKYKVVQNKVTVHPFEAYDVWANDLLHMVAYTHELKTNNGLNAEDGDYLKLMRDLSFHLVEGLINADLRKLKKCYCSLCSPKSKKTKEERRKYQGDYRKRRKEQKKDIAINYYMKTGGMTRKDAEQLWEDENM
jgi:hypothetical protein